MNSSKIVRFQRPRREGPYDRPAVRKAMAALDPSVAEIGDVQAVAELCVANLVATLELMIEDVPSDPVFVRALRDLQIAEELLERMCFMED